MLKFAIKMLVADKAKFLGILIGLTFSTFIITQQAGIFTGLMMRTYGFITDTSQNDIWVTHKSTLYIDDVKPMRTSSLQRVRSVEGVKWAVPLFRGMFKSRFQDGRFQICWIIGIDESTLIGGPNMLEGSILSLRSPDAVIVNDIGAKERLAKTYPGYDRPVPLQIGEVFEIQDRRAEVTGICKVQRSFGSEPVIYTGLSQAINYAPTERTFLSFILVKSDPDIDPQLVCDRISQVTDLAAYTTHDFKKLTVMYYIKNTGILINFGFAVALGFVIGLIISGQTFYNFALDNLGYFAIYKAMGAKNTLLKHMLAVQALFVGALGYGFGIGFTTLFGLGSRGTVLAFKFPWWLYLGSFLAILLIVLASAYLALRRIVQLDPAQVFQK